MDDPSALIIGHSFVKRYNKWIGSREKMAPPTLGHICSRVTNLQMIGIGGMMSSQLHCDDFIFQASKFDLVVIDCGTNDLARNKDPKEVVNNVFLFARRCLEGGTKMAVVTSIIPRARNIPRNNGRFSTTYGQLQHQDDGPVHQGEEDDVSHP